MRRCAAAALLAAIVLSPGASALAQEEGPVVDLPVESVDATDYPNVVITVTVPQELIGQDIPLADWFVGENGDARPISVQQLAGDELEVVLVLDTSGSMAGAPLVSAQAAVRDFADSMPSGVEMALVGFGGVTSVIVPFTEDPEELKAGVDSVTASGETALYDALLSASELFDTASQARRTVILLSDGGDTVSTATIEQALVGLVRVEPRFVAIELQTDENDDDALERLRASTLGIIVPATDSSALDGIFGEIASDLINQYRLSFQAQSHGLTEIDIAVRAGDFRALTVVPAQFPAAPPVVEPTDPSPPVTAAPPTTLPVALRPGVPVTIGFLQSTPVFLGGAAAVFLAIFGVTYLVRPRPGGLAGIQALGLSRARSGGMLSDITNRATLLAEQALGRGGFTSRLTGLIEQAGLNLRIGEFALLVVAAGLVSYLLGDLWAGVFGGVFVTVVGVTAMFGLLSVAAGRRAKAFAAQLPDALQLMAGGLRAGFGLLQAIEGVARENLEPSSTEFNRVRLEVQLGRDLEDALDAMAKRVRSEDLAWASEAITIHREIGGDLAQLLEQVAATIRERETIRRQIEVLSAEGRISAIVLVVLPIFVAVVTAAIAPTYLAELTDSSIGKILIAGGVGLMLIGIAWMRRIIRLVY
ncbi:MAG TPA: VWA domain-containing protein [Acidimicrobiia bacterium]